MSQLYSVTPAPARHLELSLGLPARRSEICQELQHNVYSRSFSTTFRATPGASAQRSELLQELQHNVQSFSRSFSITFRATPGALAQRSELLQCHKSFSWDGNLNLHILVRNLFIAITAQNNFLKWVI